LARELEWIRMSPKGRHAKGQARINSYEQMLNQQAQDKERDMELFIPPGPRLGDIVIEADKIRKGYGDRLLVEGMSFHLPPGGIVGIIGPNGAGKTTLFRMITGQEQPDGGTIRVGDTVKLAYVDQSREALDPDNSIWEEISGGQEMIELGNRTMNSRAYVSRFNFNGDQQQKKVGVRRRAQSRPSGQDAAQRIERVAAGRTDQRSGCQHHARPGRSFGELCRVCGGHQP
jgi:ATPase subunit of ABC transporter with duplicated ATPase domains